ncbi:MAG: hypothetical protein AAGB04_02260, partial [Pseudomonadota bacterium]
MSNNLPLTTLHVPECLEPLVNERRWVGWKSEYRNGKQTKPPFQIVEGEAAGYARNNQSETWSTLPEVLQALEPSGLSGIGLQLLDLKRFGEIDIDDVRDAATGEIRLWAQAFVRSCDSYCEVTPSGSGLRVLGTVSESYPPQYLRRRHPDGGSYEVYANTDTGRYITVTGDRLSASPDELRPLDSQLTELLQIERSHEPPLLGFASPERPTAATAKLLELLPPQLKAELMNTTCSDRSASFQSIVSQLQKILSKDDAWRVIQAYPDGPASKYGERLLQEFERSWRKAAILREQVPQDEQRSVGPARFATVTEDDVAQDFALIHGNHNKYDHDAKAWYRWEHDKWAKDRTRIVSNHIRELVCRRSQQVDDKRKASV